MVSDSKAYRANDNANDNHRDNQNQPLLPRYEEVVGAYTYQSLPREDTLVVINTSSRQDSILSQLLRYFNISLIYISFTLVVLICVLLWTDFPSTVANEIANGLKVEINEVHVTGVSLSEGIEVQVLGELNMTYGGVESSFTRSLISRGATFLDTVNVRPSTIKLYFLDDGYDNQEFGDVENVTKRESIYVAQAEIPFIVLNISDCATTNLNFTTRIHNFKSPKAMSKMAYMLFNNYSFEVLGQMDLVISKGWLRTGHIDLAVNEVVNLGNGSVNSTLLLANQIKEETPYVEFANALLSFYEPNSEMNV